MAPTGPQGIVVPRALTVLKSGPIQAGKATSPTLAQAMARHHVVHRPALYVGRQKFCCQVFRHLIVASLFLDGAPFHRDIGTRKIIHRIDEARPDTIAMEVGVEAAEG
jgi:hypothetical protein